MPEFGLRKILRHYIAPLLALMAVIVISLCLGISFRTKPTARETFSMFLDLPYGGVSASKVEGRIKEIDPSIKKANVFSYSPSSNQYETYYQTWGKEADLLLLSSDYLDKKDINDFVALDAIGSDGYKVDGVLYGLSPKKGESDYFDFDTSSYYCFLRKDSVHLGSLSSSSQSDLALSILKEFFDAL